MNNRVNNMLHTYRMMECESNEVNQIKKAASFIFDGEMSYMIEKYDSTITSTIENLHAHTFHVNVGDLKGCSYSEYLNNIDVFANRIGKLALIHPHKETFTLDLYKLLERLNNKLTIIDCGNQDLDVAFTTADRVRRVELNNLASEELEISLKASIAVVGVLIIREEIDLDIYRNMIKRIWDNVMPYMVSIGIVLDTSLDRPFQLQVLSFKGGYSSLPNVVEVEEEYVSPKKSGYVDENGDVKCRNATPEGTGSCVNDDEYFHQYSLYDGLCSSCFDEESPLSKSEEEGYFDNIIKLHES